MRQAEWNSGDLQIRRMNIHDIDNVLKVELKAFTAPWSRQAFVAELVENHLSEYIVLEYDHDVIGYAGVWLIVDEGHITNIAVDPTYQGKHLGDVLLKALMSLCIARGIKRMTLEVRVSNTVAQKLYKKFGFVGVGTRKGYYTDNNEDALIMWTDLPSSDREIRGGWKL